MKQMLNAAIVFAAIRHDGQYDRGGQPYVTHVLKVQYLLKTEDEELQCIAILHDVIEDTSATLEDLVNIGMTERVIRAVDLLTKKENQSYDEYLQGILSNKDAIRVKMADLRHNMDLRRLKGVREKDLKRMEKYVIAYNLLKEELTK